MRRARRRIGAGILALALATSLVACTGTSELRTPVAIVVAGNDAGGAAIDLYASPLPPSSGATSTELTRLPGFRWTADGTLVDVAVARDAPTRLVVLHRDGGDLLTTFDVSALDLDDPGSFQPGAPLDLGARVAGAGVLSGETLCSTGLAVSADGRWAGVTHVPDCDASGASGESNVLLIELDPVDGDEPEVFPPAPSTDDAPGAPAFVDRGDERLLVWPFRSGDVTGLSLDDPGASTDVAELPAPGLSDAIGLAPGGIGLVVASADELVSVDLSDGSASPAWDAPSGVTFRSVVDATSLPGAPALLLGSDELVLYPDVEDTSGDAEPIEGRVAGAVDAVVDPNGYGFVLAGGVSPRIAVFDLLTSEETLDALFGAGVALSELADPVAIDWLFAPDTPLAP